MDKCAEILSIGTELLLGDICNTDAQQVSSMLSRLGINVYWHTVVGDNYDRLYKALSLALSRADIVITTGGLGPTFDDMTKDCISRALGRKLVVDEPALNKIKEAYKAFNRPMTDNNIKQAMVIEGCTVLENEWGMAPGVAVEQDGKTIIMLPGVPKERIPMMEHKVLPYLQKHVVKSVILSHNVKIFGLGESMVEDMLYKQISEYKNPTVAPYCKDGEVLIRISAKADTKEEAEALIKPVKEEILGILGETVYGIDIESLEDRVFSLLNEKGLTVSSAESCTGGMFAGSMTDRPGSSKIFMGGVVVYDTKLKTTLLGVPEELIEENGVVSKEVSEDMARRIRKLCNTDIGIGVTGVAGPSDGGTGLEVGTVFVSLASRDGVKTRALRLGNRRSRVRLMAEKHALDMIRIYCENM